MSSFFLDAKQNPSGLGLGLRSEYFEHLKDGHSSFRWLEIITENFIDATSHTLEEISRLRSHYDLTFHGVSLSIGGQHPIDHNYLAKIKKLANRLKPAIISDHLSFSRHHHQNSHDLLPIAYTQESLNYVSERIQKIQDFLGQRFYLENPSAYLSYKISSIPEQEFIAALCKQTGCGMILDVNNLVVNQANLGLDPIQYLAWLNPQDIGYIHMAGHLDRPGVKIDTHGTSICSEVWDLYRITVQKLGPIPSMIERDQNIPDFKEILLESLKMGGLLHEAPLSTQSPIQNLSASLHSGGTTFLSSSTDSAGNHAPSKPRGLMPWQECAGDFFTAVTQKSDQGWATFASHLRHDIPTHPDIGFSVYKNGYPHRLLETLKGQMPTFFQVAGEPTLDNLLWAYLNQHPPTSYCVDRSLFGFSKFLKKNADDINLSGFFAASSLEAKAFIELAIWEQTVYEIKTLEPLPQQLTTAEFLQSLEAKTLEELLEASMKPQPHIQILDFTYDILTPWISFTKNRPLALPKHKKTFAIACSFEGKPQTQRLPKWQYRFLKSLLQGSSIGVSLVESGLPKNIRLQKALAALGYWTEKGLFASILWSAAESTSSKSPHQNNRSQKINPELTLSNPP